MTLMHRLLTGTALTLLAQTAAADITAEDVWVNQVALAERTGATVSAITDRDGATLSVTDIVWAYTFPMGAGQMSLGLGSLFLTENGDGTVAVSYGDVLPISISGEIAAPDRMTFELAMDIAFDGQVSTASGVPGDVTYSDATDNTTITLVSFDSSELSDEDELGIDLLLSIDDTRTTTRITEGDLLTIVSQSATGRTISDIGFEIGPDVTSRSVSATGSGSAIMDVALPAGPINVMNLSQALRDGMKISVEATSNDLQSQTIATLNGETVSDQSQTAAVSSQGVRLDAAGLSLTGAATDLTLDMPMDAAMPFPLNIALAGAEIGFLMPINSADDPQPFSLTVDIGGLVINEELWSLFDMSSQLPRDPVDILIGVGGTARVFVDLLDIERLVPFVDEGSIPAEINTLGTVRMALSAVGVDADADGSFVFDNTDMVTFGGLPRPEGSLTANASGVNALLDRLIAMGLIPAEEAMMPRMMLGMFARVTGDDQLSTTVEVNAEGHVIVNGQRMQ